VNFIRKVEYSKDYKKQSQSAINYTQESGKPFLDILTREVGKYKNERWAFQEEIRFALTIVPTIKNPITNQFEVIQSIQLGIEVPIKFYDLKMDDTSFSNMEINIGPHCTNSDKIIIDSLIKNLNPTATIKQNGSVKMNTNEKITFNDALGKLGMDNDSIGLRFVSKREAEKNPDLYLALEQADEFGATAVYFRFYEDHRPPRPQIYLYDKSGMEQSNDSDADIHHKLWNAGIVPFCFIFRASEVLVFNCGKKPTYDVSSNFTTFHHDLINLLSNAQQKLDLYNARKFDSGLFWESETGKKFHYQDGAYQQLLKQLSNVKSIIISRVGKEHASLVKRLLMMLILIKYLEERVDDDGKGALIPAEFYRTFNHEDPTLKGVLNNPDTFLAVLNELSKKENFNGQIFQLSDAEQQTLKKEIDLTLLQHFVMGDMEFFSKKSQSTGQMSLWKLYQFNYLPIELISHIYEDFLADENGQKKKGVVYTPPSLVQLLIDQCMPLDDRKENFKVLDPACGSGIFLVGAYKRMIQWWRLKNNWKKPGKENIE
jgi:hypothetical protein